MTAGRWHLSPQKQTTVKAHASQAHSDITHHYATSHLSFAPEGMHLLDHQVSEHTRHVERRVQQRTPHCIIHPLPFCRNRALLFCSALPSTQECCPHCHPPQRALCGPQLSIADHPPVLMQLRELPPCSSSRAPSSCTGEHAGGPKCGTGLAAQPPTTGRTCRWLPVLSAAAALPLLLLQLPPLLLVQHPGSPARRGEEACHHLPAGCGLWQSSGPGCLHQRCQPACMHARTSPRHQCGPGH
jgi:hypothetical protein